MSFTSSSRNWWILVTTVHQCLPITSTGGTVRPKSSRLPKSLFILPFSQACLNTMEIFAAKEFTWKEFLSKHAKSLIGVASWLATSASSSKSMMSNFCLFGNQLFRSGLNKGPLKVFRNWFQWRTVGCLNGFDTLICWFIIQWKDTVITL